MPTPRDPAPLWESLPERFLAAYPRLAHRNLDTWIEREDARVLGEERARPRVLDPQAVAKMLRPHLGSDIGMVERELVFGLALSIWGAEHVEAARASFHARRDGAAPFGGVDAALAFALHGEAEVGRAPGRILKSDTDSPGEQWLGAAARYDRRAERDEEKAARERRPWGGSEGVKVQGARVKGIGVCELRADVVKAVRASAVGPVDLWLVEATGVGSTVGLVERPIRVLSMRWERGVRAPVTEEHDGVYRTVALLRWPKEKGGGTGRREKLTRAQAAEALRRMAGLTAEDEGAGDEAVARRILRARKALEEAMRARGMVPTERERYRSAPPRPAPLRPTFAGDLL